MITYNFTNRHCCSWSQVWRTKSLVVLHQRSQHKTKPFLSQIDTSTQILGIVRFINLPQHEFLALKVEQMRLEDIFYRSFGWYRPIPL